MLGFADIRLASSFNTLLVYNTETTHSSYVKDLRFGSNENL